MLLKPKSLKQLVREHNERVHFERRHMVFLMIPIAFLDIIAFLLCRSVFIEAGFIEGCICVLFVGGYVGIITLLSVLSLRDAFRAKEVTEETYKD